MKGWAVVLALLTAGKILAGGAEVNTPVRGEVWRVSEWTFVAATLLLPIA